MCGGERAVSKDDRTKHTVCSSPVAAFVVGATNAFVVRVFAVRFLVKQAHFGVRDLGFTSAALVGVWHARAEFASSRGVGRIRCGAKFATSLCIQQIRYTSEHKQQQQQQQQQQQE